MRLESCTHSVLGNKPGLLIAHHALALDVLPILHSAQHGSRRPNPSGNASIMDRVTRLDLPGRGKPGPAAPMAGNRALACLAEAIGTFLLLPSTAGPAYNSLAVALSFGLILIPVAGSLGQVSGSAAWPRHSPSAWSGWRAHRRRARLANPQASRSRHVLPMSDSATGFSDRGPQAPRSGMANTGNMPCACSRRLRQAAIKLFGSMTVSRVTPCHIQHIFKENK